MIDKHTTWDRIIYQIARHFITTPEGWQSYIDKKERILEINRNRENIDYVLTKLKGKKYIAF